MYKICVCVMKIPRGSQRFFFNIFFSFFGPSPCNAAKNKFTVVFRTKKDKIRTLPRGFSAQLIYIYIYVYIYIYIYVKCFMCVWRSGEEGCAYERIQEPWEADCRSVNVCIYMYRPVNVCIYVYVCHCMHICIAYARHTCVQAYACMCVSVCIYVRVCMHVSWYACMQVCIRICMYACNEPLYVCIYRRMYVCIYVYVWMYLRMYVWSCEWPSLILKIPVYVPSCIIKIENSRRPYGMIFIFAYGIWWCLNITFQKLTFQKLKKASEWCIFK
jgi:hypothetical protein